MKDIAKRFNQNPLIRPADLKAGIEGMEIVCLLNPGVFQFDGKIWLLLRVAERPKQVEGKISFPVYNSKGVIEVLNFDKNDPDLDVSDPRIISYKKKDYLELGGNFIWLAESPDLIHWGRHKCIATSRSGMWDSARVGAGAAPVRTKEGWLEIYHGANKENRYCLGALLLDINDPSKVLARSTEPVMEPIQPYEQTGFFGNVIFTNGHYVKGDDIFIYYGASDEVICGARLSISEILSTLI